MPAPGGAAAAPAEQQVAAADEHELVSRLRALLPREAKASTRARVLREACVYIRRLHAEVDSLAERLAQLLEDDDAADDEVTIRNLLM